MKEEEKEAGKAKEKSRVLEMKDTSARVIGVDSGRRNNSVDILWGHSLEHSLSVSLSIPQQSLRLKNA